MTHIELEYVAEHEATSGGGSSSTIVIAMAQLRISVLALYIRP
jgi:formiminotetrahydrofolate cyclodeaminase